jgi:hypothetical protein
LGLNLKQDKNFEPAIMQLEMIIRECSALKNEGQTVHFSTQALQSLDLSTLIALCQQLIHFIEFRFQMMSLYADMREREKHGAGPTSHIEWALRQLNDLETAFGTRFSPASSFMTHLRTLYRFGF